MPWSRLLRVSLIVASLLYAVPASAQQICSAAWEWIEANNDNGRIALSCPNGGVIYWIDFASYGTPNPVPLGYDPDDFTATSQANPTLAPVCASLTALSSGSCESSTSVEVVEAACLGQSSCEVEASNDVFGDPCFGTFKRLYATATCGPATADQCKAGGWQTYGIFTNQGDCVSFVATGGQNEPGKNVK